MGKLVVLTGRRFGKLVVGARAPTVKTAGSSQTRWHVTCDCGAERIVSSPNLMTGDSVSCGCHKLQQLVARSTSHGHASQENPSRTYISWRNMVYRITNPKCKQYQDYMGRGITACPEWLESFENFLRDMGECPEGLTLEREDVNGHYEPGNCVWANRVTQANNRRGSVTYAYEGRCWTAAQWAEHWGLTYHQARARLRRAGSRPQKLNTLPATSHQKGTS